MIIPLFDTDTNQVARKLVGLREDSGASALGRVLTLVILTKVADQVEDSIQAANVASLEHPCRVIVTVRGDRASSQALDAEIRLGGDAGASEVVVLRSRGELVDHQRSLIMPLLLPDAPIVAWWPAGVPPTPPGQSTIGSMASRRITSSPADPDPAGAIERMRTGYTAGDTDLAWSRITRWRAQLAAELDRPPYEPVRSAVVTGAAHHTSTDLLAAWLAKSLRCPVQVDHDPSVAALSRVVLNRASGPIVLYRPEGSSEARISRPGLPDQHVALARRMIPDCLAEELRRLDPDAVYGEVVRQGLDRLAKTAQ